jgi:hypothetical protein
LTIDYSTAAFDDFDGKPIANGDTVEVKGTMLAASGALIATRVQFEGESALDGAGPNEDFELEGFISSINGTMSIVVTGVTIQLDSGTQFEGGTLADLAVNVKVGVEGATNSAGNFVATKVEIKKTAALRVSANVDAAPDLQNGRLTVLGITIGTSPTTQFEDDTHAVEFFGLANINAGDRVAVRGFIDATGTVDMTATRIERDEPDDVVELRGPAASVTGTTLNVLGITIVTTSSTVFHLNDTSLTAAEFFSQLAVGDSVNCDGTKTGTSEITAAELELETDD